MYKTQYDRKPIDIHTYIHNCSAYKKVRAKADFITVRTNHNGSFEMLDYFFFSEENV